MFVKPISTCRKEDLQLTTNPDFKEYKALDIGTRMKTFERQTRNENVQTSDNSSYCLGR